MQWHGKSGNALFQNEQQQTESEKRKTGGRVRHSENRNVRQKLLCQHSLIRKRREATSLQRVTMQIN